MSGSTKRGVCTVCPGRSIMSHFPRAITKADHGSTADPTLVRSTVS